MMSARVASSLMIGIAIIYGVLVNLLVSSNWIKLQWFVGFSIGLFVIYLALRRLVVTSGAK